MLLDYPTLRLIWWLLLGILLIAVAVMDGFDLGIGMLLHRVAKTDEQRRIVVNTIGPVWEGNQIWFVLGGGAIFAAWPLLYAAAFSGFYFAMLLVLLGLIVRPVGFKYRSKITHPRWRQAWDLGLFCGGFLPALVFGVAMGNMLQGVPFHFDATLRIFYTGSFWALLNPFALLCGLVSIAMLLMHGGAFLGIKTAGDVQRRAATYTRIAALLTIVLFAIGGYWVAQLPGYTLSQPPAFDAPTNPLHKQVLLYTGAWLNNYAIHPMALTAPLLGFLGALTCLGFTTLRYYHCAWVASACSVAGIVSTVGVSTFPFLLPSSTHPNMSLTIWDASSSQLTLMIMLIASLVFLPIIVLYTSWVYYVLRGKVTDDYIEQHKNDVY